MAISESRLRATVVRNNIKQHDYTIEKYEMPQDEAEVVLKALERYIDDLKFEQELKVYGYDPV